MEMNNFLSSPFGFYIVMTFLNAAMLGGSTLIQKGKQKVESEVATIFPAEDAVKVNDFLDTVERLTNAAVQNANSLIVSGLKEKNLFTSDTANAVKQSVITEVLNNLGPLKDKGMELVGPLENIIGQLIEKYVVKSKVA
jgi:hypothetical protein